MTTEELRAHIADCPTCAKAASHVNEFCDDGRRMFAEWAQDHTPTNVELREASDEQYRRLLEEQTRRARQARNN